jgi:hypothetical protein
MATSTIWISFDLGVRGDYEGLYAWLDRHGAKECGDSIAFLKYQHNGEMIAALKEDLLEAVDTTRKTRFYVMYREPDTRVMKGKFIVGGRKASPWEGYSGASTQADEDSQ